MTDSPTVRIEGGIKWQTLTSSKGQQYEFGTPEGEQAHKAELKSSSEHFGMMPSKSNFGIDVNWPTTRTKDTDWIDTDDKVKTTAAITRYNLIFTGGSTYPWELNFTNTEHYDYYFEDETGDRYECNTYRNGDHWVRYKSDKPDIINITGS